MTENCSTEDLIRLALAAPEESLDYRQERWHFIHILQCRGDRDVLERAITLTNSSDPDEKTIGICILGQLGIPTRIFPEECVATLIGLLEQERDPLILEDICIALGHLQHPRSVEPQLRFCLHPDWEVRYGVAYGLSGQADERAIAALIHLSSDEHPQVRDWATFGLGSLLEVDTPEIREALYQRFLNEDTEDDETVDIYYEALAGLACRKDERVLVRLIEELSSNNVSILALEAAESFADRRLCPALLQMKSWCKEPGLDAAIAACCHS